jgi:nucleoside-diphosphate-sugar epimerase
VDYQWPVVIVRIFSFYGPRGGGVTQRIDQIIRDEPVSVYPGVRNVHTPLYQDDYVEKTAAAASIAKVGAEIINVGGTEPMTTQEYCQIAGEMLGKEPTFAENSKAWPIWADTTKMVDLLGPNKISVREGVRRTIEAAQDRLNTSHHVIGEPAKV